MTRSEAITELYALFDAPLNLTRLNRLLDELTEFPPAQQQALTNEQCRGKELLRMVFDAMSYGNAQDRESARLAVGAALAVQPAQQRKPLTDKEVWSAIRPLTKSHEVCEALVRISMAEYRAIEAAHGIKENT